MVYGASPLKVKRRRSTKAELDQLDARLIQLARTLGPITIRGLYYQATVEGLVPKTELACRQIERRVLKLRRSGQIPYNLISDESMSMYGNTVYASLGGFADDAADQYHKDYWKDSKVQVHLFLEKRALASVITPIVNDKWGLALYVGGGQQSETLIYRAGRDIAINKKRAVFYVISDFDPGGARMFKAFATGTDEAPGGLSRFTRGVRVDVKRLALTEAQIKKFNLPTRDVKKTDPDAQKWIREHGDVSAELDAFRPDQLRTLIDETIAKHMSQAELDSLKETEENEREAIRLALVDCGNEDELA